MLKIEKCVFPKPDDRVAYLTMRLSGEELGADLGREIGDQELLDLLDLLAVGCADLFARTRKDFFKK